MRHFIGLNVAILLLSAYPAVQGGEGGAPAAAPRGSELKGPLADPSFFPIAVWLQDPAQAKRYKEAGINLYVALWRGPTEAQLRDLKAAGMPVICEQNRVALAHKDDPIIVGWMHGDEPDNAQEIVDRATGKRRYGPPVPPARIVAEYQALRVADSTRPIMLNLGQGVANDEWVGRGPGASIDDYPAYVQGCDIVSFDVYPIAGLDRKDAADLLWYVAKGVDRLIKWTGGRQRIWNCIECTHISNPKAKATPHQMRAEVWMSLVHGSRGLIYFVHQFQPRFNEHALLDDPEMLAAVTAINRQIRELAPVLNGLDVAGVASVRSSKADVPIDLTTRQHGKTTYVFAVGMRNAPARGAFEIKGLAPQAVAEVLGEHRRITIKEGRFEDDFRPYDVHLYAIATD
jgi:hypothetical protein